MIEALSAYQVVLVIVANLKTEVITTYGDRSKLKYGSILRYSYDQMDTLKTLYDSLQTRLLPTITSQGEVRCVTCIPIDQVLVGVFYHNQINDKIEAVKYDYQTSKKIDIIVKNLIASS